MRTSTYEHYRRVCARARETASRRVTSQGRTSLFTLAVAAASTVK